MKYIVYPAVLEVDQNDKTCYFNFQDLNILSIGLTVEEAYLRACADFQTYVNFVEKFDFPVVEPTKFEEFQKLNPKKHVMLFRAEVAGKNIKLKNDEAAYKNIIASMIE